MDGEQILYSKNDTGEFEEYTPPSFQESIPEDLREHESLKEITDVGSLTKNYVDLYSSQPQRPENPGAYEIAVPEEMPIVEEDLNAFKEAAYETGLTQEQFKGVMNHYLDREKRLADQYRADIERHREESLKQLKMEYGDAYEEKAKSASNFLIALGDRLGGNNVDAFRKWLDDTKFGDDPMVIRLLATAAELISEDAFIKGDRRQPEGERPMG
ncbi:MAG: hypothetical protein GWN94_14000, partial [Phycisphaerae bacterium]|nr:hypothetical protein [Phycisphaerae bacterium]